MADAITQIPQSVVVRAGSACACGRHARARQAFTLLELMLVLAVTLAIAALSFPLYAPLLQRQGFDTSVEEVIAQCTRARAEAQARGVAVEVAVTAGGTRLETRVVDLMADAQDDPATEERTRADGMDAALRGSAIARAEKSKWDAAMARRAASGTARNPREDDGAVLQRPLGELALEDGVVASIEAPAVLETESGVGDAAGEGEVASMGAVRGRSADSTEAADAAVAGSAAGSAGGADAGMADGRIALFLPDGSATAVRGVWVVQDGGARMARVEVDALLGRAVRRDVRTAARTGM